MKAPDWSVELIERQRVLLEIVRLAARLDVQFAFPTQTIEVERFPGLGLLSAISADAATNPDKGSDAKAATS